MRANGCSRGIRGQYGGGQTPNDELTFRPCMEEYRFEGVKVALRHICYSVRAAVRQPFGEQF